MDCYKVKKINDDIVVKVPGSKSITNRALLLAALADGTSTVTGALKSDDSMHFLNCLKELGFAVMENGDSISITGMAGKIPQKEGKIYVGSAGTAARFLTAMLAFSEGVYKVEASPQMSKRPMKDLIAALEKLGAQFKFIGHEYSFPFVVTGRYVNNQRKNDVSYNVAINIDKSSQYLSALLMTASMLDGPLAINLEGERTAKSYVDITMKMMEEFGIKTIKSDESNYLVQSDNGSSYKSRAYEIEPDMSAACYFYAMAAVNGIKALVKGVYKNNMQGDMKFLDVLADMGCVVEEKEEGIEVSGPHKLSAVEVDMSDFSDQTLTLAAIAPFADGKVTIKNVAHIRNQESDRLAAIGCAYEKMNIKYEMYPDGICIYPGTPSEAMVETFDDHRIAMSFAVTGTKTGNITILNPMCCRKTFPEYFNVLEKLN